MAATETAPWTREAISARISRGFPSSNSFPAEIAMNTPLPIPYRVPHGVLDHGRGIRRAGAADAHVDDFRAVVRRVADAARDGLVGPDVRRAEDVVPDAVDDLDRHQLDVEGHARGADVVVGQLAD